jgi:Lrp/AsnC family transcriptional regulator, leucine-responsive regulatory protein
MIDHVDRMLLALLKQDARRKYSELGAAVHLSAPAVHERVKRLERARVLRRYTIDFDPLALGLALHAFVRIHTSRTSCEELAQALQKFPEVEECFSSAGEEAMLIKVRTATPASLEELLDRVRLIPGVERLLTSIVLTTHFQRAYIPTDQVPV